MPKQKIELYTEDLARIRIEIDARISKVFLPIAAKDGFGQICYMDSGLQTDDGTEIWTRQGMVAF